MVLVISVHKIKKMFRAEVGHFTYIRMEVNTHVIYINPNWVIVGYLSWVEQYIYITYQTLHKDVMNACVTWMVYTVRFL